MPVTLHWVYKRPSEKGGLWGPPFSLFPGLLQQPSARVVPEHVRIAHIGLIDRLVTAQ
jgi:hypothetical protein